MTKTGLDALLTPASVAVIGASSRAGHFANQPIANLLRFGFTGAVYPVNPHRDEIDGVRCFPGLAHLPDVPDLAVIVVPPEAAVAALAECGEAGVGAAVIVASGFAESGQRQKAALQAEIGEIRRRTGIRVCGPNTLGIANWNDSIVPLASGNVPPEPKSGAVAVVSQSGGLGFTIVNRAWALDVGVGHLAVAGNEADVSIPELASWYLERPDVRTIACYTESIRDAEGLRLLGRRAGELGKPVFVLKSGRSEQGRRAASAHTGALATADDVCDAALRQWGLHRVDSLDGLLNAAALAAHIPPAPSGGVGVYCQGGGIAVVASDLLSAHGIDLPPIALTTSAAITELLPDSNAANPLDSGGQFLSVGPAPLVEALGRFDSDPSVGVVVVMAMPVLGARAAVYTEAIERAAATSATPYVAIQYGAGSLTAETTTRFRTAGLVVLDPPSGAVEGLAAWLRSGRPVTTAGTIGPWRSSSTVRDQARALVTNWLESGLTTVPEHEAVRLLHLYDITAARQCLATDRESAVQAAEALSGPFVLKIASPQLPHRSDVDGIRLGVLAPDVGDGFDDLVRHVRAVAPQADIAGVSVVEMAPSGLELILGTHRDPTFGHVIVSGLGGVFTEVLDDVAMRLPPITSAEAVGMLRGLRASAVLDRFRGSEAVDVAAVAEIVTRLAAIVADLDDVIAAIDLNPVIAYPVGRPPVVADALIELRRA